MYISIVFNTNTGSSSQFTIFHPNCDAITIHSIKEVGGGQKEMVL